MGQLFNRRVVLGVTGGIAAYKSAQLVREFRESGAAVRVVMTKGATEFITPLTMQALSGEMVSLDLLDSAAEAAMGHIELARWADVVVVAPATADFLSRLAQGRADDLLTTLCLATGAKGLLAPAMNQAMWRNPATAANIACLAERGYLFVDPAEGSQACGDEGPGRMEEPPRIAAAAAALFGHGPLDGLRVAVTAGPTQEALDPVRYLSNRSSGKMGFALAQAAADAGAAVTLIAGPVALPAPERVRRIDVTTATEMMEASLGLLGACDIFIGCAAVADYRPAAPAAGKIKKEAETVQLELTRNPDIIAAVAAQAQELRPFTVGFAAETAHLKRNAAAKLKAKNLDMIVANDVSASGAGFNSDNNAALVLWQGGSRALELSSKPQLAARLIEIIAAGYNRRAL